MPCLITVPIRSDIKKTMRQKKQPKKLAKLNFAAKTDYLNLKAHSNNVKMQSDNTLTTQINFLPTMQRIESFLNETMLQVNKENDQ